MRNPPPSPKALAKRAEDLGFDSLWVLDRILWPVNPRAPYPIDELIKALKKIWTTDPVEFQRKYYRIPKSFIGPKSVQKPHPPIYMAAYAPSALERVATEANGWLPVGIPLSGGVGPMFDGIKSMAKNAGRDPSAIELIVGANVEIHNAPIQKDRVDFTVTLEQIAEDATTARKLGAAEIVINAKFSPGVETAKRSCRADGRSLAGSKASMTLWNDRCEDRAVKLPLYF